MKDSAPPPAKITRHPVYGKECWICYWCETFFCDTGFAGLTAREVWKCRRCGRFQILGNSESVRSAAAVADREEISKPIADEAVPPLPSNLDRIKLATIQETYDSLKRKHKAQPSQNKVYQFSGHARSTVREYWPFVRK